MVGLTVVISNQYSTVLSVNGCVIQKNAFCSCVKIIQQKKSYLQHKCVFLYFWMLGYAVETYL